MTVESPEKGCELTVFKKTWGLLVLLRQNTTCYIAVLLSTALWSVTAAVSRDFGCFYSMMYFLLGNC